MKKFKFFVFLFLMLIFFGVLCSCGNNEEKEHVHNWLEINKTTVTCTEDGKITYLCHGCDKTKIIVIEQATGHKEVIDKAVEATCTTTGLTEGKHCSKCNEVLVEQEEVAVLGHSHSTEWSKDTSGHWHACVCGDKADKTCHISSGPSTEEADEVCMVCGYIIAPKLNHEHAYNVKVENEDTLKDKATCTENAVYYYSCRCTEISTELTYEKQDSALGHTKTEAVKENEVASTCKVAGSYDLVVYCSVCEAEISREEKTLPLAKHIEEVVVGKTATCIETGLTEGKHCSVCDEVLVAQQIVPALGHKESEAVVENNVLPTCILNGSYDSVVYCSVCKEELSCETVVVEALGHTEVIDAAILPTCTLTGLTEGKHCSVCNEVLITQTVVPVLGHTFGEWYEIISPTCIKVGSEQRDCGVCTYYEIQEKVALGHELINHNYKAPTCIEIGYDAYEECSRCDYSTYVEVPATGHSYESVITLPTCTLDGYTRYTCHCGDTYIANKILALGHTEVIDAAVSATCTTTGLTEGKHCSVCDDVLVIQSETPKLEHTIGDPKVENLIESTCTKVGNYDEVVYCSGCNKEISRETKVIEKEEHSEVKHEGKAATCLIDGYKTYVTCSNCDYTTFEKIEATGHKYEKIIVNPTCTKNGFICDTCKDCGDSYVTDYLSALGHNYIEVVIVPTCVTDGYTTYVCENDNTHNYVDSYVDALGHTEVIDKAVAPTCTAPGLTEGKHCSVCDEVLVAQTMINALGHIYESKITEPTCEEEGYTTHTCSCGETYIDSHVDAKGHNYFDYICISCNYNYYTSGLIFSASNIDSYCVTGYNGNEKNIIIPSVYEGKPVKGIGQLAFKDCVFIESVYIPDSVDGMSSSTFFRCTKLEKVRLSEKIQSIYESTFFGCSSLKEIVIPESVTKIHKSAFSGCDSLEKVYYQGTDEQWNKIDIFTENDCLLNAEIEFLYNHALDDGIIIKEASCLESGELLLTCLDCKKSIVKEIQPLGHSEVIDSKVEASCEKTGKTEGSHCSVCGIILVKQKITVKDHEIVGNECVNCNYNAIEYTEGLVFRRLDNNYYSVSDYVGAEKHVVIPAIYDNRMVIRIDPYAFQNCSSLTTIKIPNSITYIGYGAFSGCSSLENITILGNINYIDSYTFQNCSSLSSVTLSLSVTSIEYGAFNGCSSLINVDFIDNVTKIGGLAFAECISLQKIDLPLTVEEIGDYAFSGCSSLTSITIPEGVIKIGSSAFERCSELKNVIISDSVLNIGDHAFSECEKLESVKLSKNITKIDNEMFYHCKKLKNVEFSSNIVAIGDYAFSGCESLIIKELPEKLTTIGQYAFSNCYSIETIKIPQYVKLIGNGAFYRCRNLKTVYNYSNLKIEKNSTDNGYIGYYATLVLKKY